ncbi:MAG: SEC-C metal-binding domain-containing protein [Steroidobacteraceae bacterium]
MRKDLPVAQPVDFERLLPDAVAAALATQRWEALREWLLSALPDYLDAGSCLLDDPRLHRALAFALGRALWNVLPLPRNGFLPEPVPEPGRNDPCPCGSGEKYKRCCDRAPPLAGFTTAMLWPQVLRALGPAERRMALASHQVPRMAIADYADDALAAGQARAVIELLSPEFEPLPRHTDGIASAMLLTLCDAYDTQRGGGRRKRALLERMTQIPARSPLRSDACQRLACIEMDQRHSTEAWRLFRQAQQDNPLDPALGMLEVQLLVGEGESERARERARFHLAQLRRRGEEVKPRLVEFMKAVIADPDGALSSVAMDIEGGAGQSLADWIDTVRERPLPAYRLEAPPSLAPAPGAELERSLRERLRQMGVRGQDLDRAVADMVRQVAALESAPASGPRGEPADAGAETPALTAPPAIAALSATWHEVFPLDKPFSVHPLPFDVDGIWEEEQEAAWTGYLAAHPEAFDSLDILDDIATAVFVHPQGDQPSLQVRLLLPLLERAVAILESAVAARPDVELTWADAAHRPALRALLRLAELAANRGDAAAARALRERLLGLNPGDNHGVRYVLAIDLLRSGEAAGCLALTERHAEDPAPELRFNEALARYRLGQAKSAMAALRRAHRDSPRVARYLLATRIRTPKIDPNDVSLAGDDRAWLYREAMRAAWKETPGALEWLRKVIGGAG